MRRHLALLDYALGALRRRAARNLAIVVGMAMVVWLFASVLFLTDALRREFALGIDAAPDLTAQQLVAGRPSLIAAGALDPLRERLGVVSVEPRVWGYLYLPSLQANVTVVGLPLGAAPEDASAVVSGRLPRAPGEMAIGAELARRLGVRHGDHMALPKPGGFHLLEVAGSFRSESALRTADLLLTTETDARLLLGVPDGMATDVAVRLGHPDEGPVVARAIDELLPGARVLERPLLRRTYELTFDQRGGLLAAMGLPALVALLLLAWERLTGLSAAERREVGVLKAIGWETRDVLTARVWESAVVAFFGTVAGIVSAYVFVFFLEAPGLSSALFGWSALYPPLTLTPSVDLAQVATLLCAVVVPYVGVSLVPAFLAATVDPDAAMRGVS